MQYSTLRPGLLVALSTRVSGNVSYHQREIEAEHVDADGAERARWETERTVLDRKEHDEATQVRSKCRTLILAFCAKSTFGLLCPETQADELWTAVEEAQGLASEFNSAAKLTRVSVSVLAGRIAPDDEQATRAITSEIRSLLDDMERGVRNLDAKAIREAADQARNVGTMLAPDSQVRVQMAIDAARKAARKIVKAGEAAAIEIDQRAIRQITESRTAFLDLDDVVVTEASVADLTEFDRAIDLEPVASPGTIPQDYQLVGETFAQFKERVGEPLVEVAAAPAFAFEME